MVQEESAGLSLEPDRSCRHSLGINSSPAEVYQALTDPALLRRWFVSEAEIDLKPGGAYRWVFGQAENNPGDEALVTTGEFLAVVKQELLRLKAVVADLDTEVEFRIDPWRDGAILTVSHSGFPGDEEWDDTFRALDRGWQTELYVLKVFLERGRGLTRTTERHERLFEASAEELFDCFTTSAGLGSWLADRASVDASPGGEMRLEWDGRSVGGHFAVCDPDRFLLMTWEEEQPSLVRIWIDDEVGGGKTELKLDHLRFVSESAPSARFDWDGALDRMVASVRLVRKSG